MCHGIHSHCSSFVDERIGSRSSSGPADGWSCYQYSHHGRHRKYAGERSLWVYLLTIIGGALFFGILVNEFLPREWFTGALPSLTHVHDHQTGWFKWASSAFLVLLILNGYFMKLISSQKEKRKDKEKANIMEKNILQYRVEGMTCDHCKATVENGLKDLQGVSEVLADRSNNQVTVQAESVSETQIKETIEKLGYRFAGKI